MGLFATLKYTTTDATPQTYYFRGKSDIYTGTIATETSVSVAPATEQNRPQVKVEELVASGILIRLVVSTGQIGSSSRKQVKLLCGRNKLATALDNLEGDTIRGNSIFSVRVPQKASFF